MKTHNLLLAIALTGCGAIAACSSPSVITTKDGEQIMTADEPEVDEREGFVRYETDGKDAQLNTSEVRSIEQVR